MQKLTPGHLPGTTTVLKCTTYSDNGSTNGRTVCTGWCVQISVHLLGIQGSILPREAYQALLPREA